MFPGDDVARHPSQLYEALLEGPALLLVLWSAKKLTTLRDGQAAALFLMVYVTMFDPTHNLLTEMTEIPFARSTLVAGALSDGRIILATGNGPGETKEAWIGTLN